MRAWEAEDEGPVNDDGDGGEPHVGIQANDFQLAALGNVAEFAGVSMVLMQTDFK